MAQALSLFFSLSLTTLWDMQQKKKLKKNSKYYDDTDIIAIYDDDNGIVGKVFEYNVC